MKQIAFLAAALFLAASFMFTACNKEEDPTPPSISFKSETGYISSDVALKYGDSIWFGVTAKSNGTDKLVKFQIYGNGTLLLDSTISTDDFNMTIVSSKTILDKEVWKFVATDIVGNTETDSITVTGDFGDINKYNGLVLGAQNNTAVKGFISYSNSAATSYTQDVAFNHQEDIDMFLFYENTPSHVNLMTLAAPGSNITGIFTGTSAPENYTTKNVTYFCNTELTATAFDLVNNDALILASFDINNKFKKAKLLTIGDVYAFKLQSGKFGLLKVTNVNGEEDGTLEFDVKIQK